MHGLAWINQDVLDALHHAERWIEAQSSIAVSAANALPSRDEQPPNPNPEYG